MGTTRGPETIDPASTIPTPVLDLLEELWRTGHAGYVVGGSLRDALLGRPAADWDLATDARPERIVEIFPGASYENRFGTVAVRWDGEIYQVTTFRSDHDYADHRRPHRIEFGDSIELDLARRDFTVNAMAWGALPPTAGSRPEPRLVDPYGGRADASARVLRAVGDPVRRLEEDALRIVRAVRLAATLELVIEADTRAAIEAQAELVRHLSGERIAAELDKLLAAPQPSAGLRLLAETGVLDHIAPALAAQRGVSQNKVAGEDLWDHTLRSVDAVPASRPVIRLAALLHDLGKPATAADGHFYGHDRVGAELAAAFLERLHYPRAVTDRIVALVRHHMFTYDDGWSDTAVRRFIGKIGRRGLDELFELRAADNVGSGLPSDAAGLADLRRRVAEQLAADVALDRGDLVVDGDDLIAELGLRPGPMIGRVLDELVERVLAAPALNDRPSLLLLARSLAEDES
ncbi:MAG: HD domain-containing protein [Chloroflexota bacterium]|nr:HD domain-containing protein [Chloroflexota bacterium]